MKRTDYPFATQRNVIEIYKSFYICVPKQWIIDHGIKKGQTLPVICSDDMLRVIPPFGTTGQDNPIAKLALAHDLKQREKELIPLNLNREVKEDA